MTDNGFIHLCTSLKCGYFFSFYSASPTFSILKSRLVAEQARIQPIIFVCLFVCKASPVLTDVKKNP